MSIVSGFLLESIPSFSRHAKTDASIALVIWLNENVPKMEPTSHDGNIERLKLVGTFAKHHNHRESVPLLQWTDANLYAKTA